MRLPSDLIREAALALALAGARRREAPSMGRHAAPCGCKACADGRVSTHQRRRANDATQK